MAEGNGVGLRVELKMGRGKRWTWRTWRTWEILGIHAHTGHAG